MSSVVSHATQYVILYGTYIVPWCNGKMRILPSARRKRNFFCSNSNRALRGLEATASLEGGRKAVCLVFQRGATSASKKDNGDNTRKCCKDTINVGIKYYS